MPRAHWAAAHRSPAWCDIARDGAADIQANTSSHRLDWRRMPAASPASASDRRWQRTRARRPGRAVREVHHLGEIQAHLELRIHPDAKPAITLEHQPLAHIDDGIRAGSARPLDRQSFEIGTGNLCECRGRPEAQLAGGHGNLAARRHCRDHRAAKQFIRKRIAHHPHIGLLANLRHGGGRQIFDALIFALFPGQPKRQESSWRAARCHRVRPAP